MLHLNKIQRRTSKQFFFGFNQETNLKVNINVIRRLAQDSTPMCINNEKNSSFDLITIINSDIEQALLR